MSMKSIAEKLPIFILVFGAVMLVSVPLKATISSEYFILALAFCTAVVVMVITYLVGILRSPEDR